MRQAFRIYITKMLSCIAVMSIIAGMGMLASCKSNNSADLVVYGKIFTAEGNQVVEAFAVKDGKYVYVGDKAGAEAFVEEGKTEVIDYTGKGLVMPSCGNGHAHYALGYAIQAVGTVMDRADGVDKFLKEIVPAAVKKAKDNGATVVFGSGWDMMKFPKDLCYRKMLDEVCSDIPIYFADEEGHKGLANTILLKKAGLIKEDGTAGKTEVRQHGWHPGTAVVRGLYDVSGRILLLFLQRQLLQGRPADGPGRRHALRTGYGLGTGQLDGCGQDVGESQRHQEI